MSGKSKDNYENNTMRILTGIGMILVVAGHLKLNLFDIGGLFPYYSFHVLLFVFVSGYFYEDEYDAKPFSFILKKAKGLLLPYYLTNVVYGVISTVLNGCGIYVGQRISLYNLLVAPVLGGHQFMYNSPAWFMVALFVVETVYVLARYFLCCVLKTKTSFNDFVTTVSFMIAGILVVYLAMQGKAWGIYRDFGRWIIMLPAVCFGRCFRVWIQPVIRKHLCGIAGIRKYICYVVALLAILLLQIVIVKLTGGLISYSVVWCGPFATGPLMPFITMVTGIGFWYTVASLISQLPIAIPSRFFSLIGHHSRVIMTNHLMVLFIINSVCMLICKGNISAHTAVYGFDMEAYISDITYQYMYWAELLVRLINLVLCIVIPVGLSCALNKFVPFKILNRLGLRR